jgi:hypothetical protein
MPFAIEKRNSFFRSLQQNKLPICLTNSDANQIRPSNAPICLGTEYSEKSRDRTRKKSASSNLAHNLRIGAKKL